MIEHLDPEPLARFGEVLLGGCRPAHALVSTPNREYNAVWHPTLPLSELPLRNADHRFEWTREQMRRWAEPLARTHGYDVRFVGVGGDLDETEPSPSPSPFTLTLTLTLILSPHPRPSPSPYP